MKEIMRGPDISVHNGLIDFNKIKDKYGFVLIRCGYGGNYVHQDDEYFLRNAEECEKLNIPYGVYLYSYADTKEKALSEAKHVLRLIKGRKISFGIWYDMEDKTLPEDKDLLSDIAVTFLEEIESQGHYCGIYASKYFFENRFIKEKIAPYDKWVALWNKEDTFKEAHGMWQFTSKAKIEGLEGDFDMNIAYKNYPEIIKNMENKEIYPKEITLHFKDRDLIYKLSE